MKKQFFLALSFLLVLTITVNAQDYKDAKKAYNTFTLDAFNNKPKLKEAKEARDKMVSDAKEQARVEANKIIAEAQQAINAQKMAAITEVKNQVGKLVIEVTEKVLRRELSNPQAQEAHIKGLVDEVKLN